MGLVHFYMWHSFKSILLVFTHNNMSDLPNFPEWHIAQCYKGPIGYSTLRLGVNYLGINDFQHLFIQ